MTGLLPLSEVRKRLAAADRAVAALVLIQGSDAVRPITDALTDLRGLLRAAEMAAGRTLAGGSA